MITKFIEATEVTNFNWGKFAVCRFESSEWARPSELRDLRDLSDAERPRSVSLLRERGWTAENILVLDLQTGEGAIFRPGGSARNDLNDKHQVWVCPLFESFLCWLYRQDLADISALPSLINLGDVPTSMSGYRRTRNG